MQATASDVTNGVDRVRESTTMRWQAQAAGDGNTHKKPKPTVASTEEDGDENGAATEEGVNGTENDRETVPARTTPQRVTRRRTNRKPVQAIRRRFQPR